ncbi:MAG: hypothetical protein IJJ13_00825 [Lachnospiraceae bacterium]|nr:hypothetical protein [Lachnospiraceae bacterium]
MIENQLIEKELSEEMLEKVSGGKQLVCTDRMFGCCPFRKKDTYIRRSNHKADVRFNNMRVVRQVYTNRCEECGKFFYGPDKQQRYYDVSGNILK